MDRIIMAGNKRDTFNEINITPLTDIFLVLLIIMMVIAPLLDNQGLNLTVPEIVKEENLKKDAKLLNVLVTNDDKYFIDDKEVTLEELPDVLKKESVEKPDGLLIQSQPDSTHGAVVKLMDNARNSGITSISVVEG
ncbi:biopolymer transporter ExbD [bacterium]|nr:biopolymer transporter ExbD [bacterium]